MPEAHAASGLRVEELEVAIISDELTAEEAHAKLAALGASCTGCAGTRHQGKARLDGRPLTTRELED